MICIWFHVCCFKALKNDLFIHIYIISIIISIYNYKMILENLQLTYDHMIVSMLTRSWMHSAAYQNLFMFVFWAFSKFLTVTPEWRFIIAMINRVYTTITNLGYKNSEYVVWMYIQITLDESTDFKKKKKPPLKWWKLFIFIQGIRGERKYSWMLADHHVDGNVLRTCKGLFWLALVHFVM